MEALREWLQSSLGFSPVFQDVFLFPVLVTLLIWGIARGILAILFLNVTAPKRRERLRTLSTYFAVLLVAVFFCYVCLAGIRQMGALLDDRSQDEVEAFQAHFTGALYAIFATAVLALLVKFIRKLLKTLASRVETWAQTGPPIRLRGLDLFSRDGVKDTVLLVARGARAILFLLLLYIYVPLVLSFFPVTATYGDQLMQHIWRPAAEMTSAVIDYLPKLLYLAVLLVAVRYALRGLRFLLGAVGRGALVIGGFDRDWADPTYKLIRILVVVFALMIGYPYLPGAESKFFQGFSLFVGALVTLGSTAAIGNMVSGVILTYTRAFRIGDRVRIGDAFGDVLVKSLFVTQLRTIKNEDVTIPNSLVLGGHVVNYSNAANRRELVLTTEVGIGYDVRWSKVEDLLKEAAVRTSGILAEPVPYVWPKALGDFAVVYELHAYTDRADQMGAIYAELRRNILDELHDAGVEIMTPDVHALRDASRAALPAEGTADVTKSGSGIRVDIAGPRHPTKV